MVTLITILVATAGLVLLVVLAGRAVSHLTSVLGASWREVVASFRAPSICPLHGRTLIPREVPAIYGLVEIPDKEDEACGAMFPYGLPMAFCGCDLPDTPDPTVEVRSCPDCCAAHRKWATSHPSAYLASVESWGAHMDHWLAT